MNSISALGRARKRSVTIFFGGMLIGNVGYGYDGCFCAAKLIHLTKSQRGSERLQRFCRQVVMAAVGRFLLLLSALRVCQQKLYSRRTC